MFKISHGLVLRQIEHCDAGTAAYRLGCGVGILVVPLKLDGCLGRQADKLL